MAEQGKNETQIAFIFRPAAVFFFLSAVVLVLSGAGFLAAIIFLNSGAAAQQFTMLFLLGEDANVPTWYASTTLLIAAVVLGLITAAKWRQQARFRFHWLALALIFLFLSMDETAMVHERSGQILKEMAPVVEGVGGVLRYKWIMIALPLLALLAAMYVRFLLHLPRRTCCLFVAAAALFLGGAVVVEMANAYVHDLTGTHTLRYQGMTVVEEFLEMAGVLVFLYALLDYAKRTFGDLVLRVDMKEAPERSVWRSGNARAAGSDRGPATGSALARTKADHNPLKRT